MNESLPPEPTTGAFLTQKIKDEKLNYVADMEISFAHRASFIAPSKKKKKKRVKLVSTEKSTKRPRRYREADQLDTQEDVPPPNSEFNEENSFIFVCCKSLLILLCSPCIAVFLACKYIGCCWLLEKLCLPFKKLAECLDKCCWTPMITKCENCCKPCNECVERTCSKSLGCCYNICAGECCDKFFNCCETPWKEQCDKCFFRFCDSCCEKCCSVFDIFKPRASSEVTTSTLPNEPPNDLPMESPKEFPKEPWDKFPIGNLRCFSPSCHSWGLYKMFLQAHKHTIKMHLLLFYKKIYARCL